MTTLYLAICLQAATVMEAGGASVRFDRFDLAVSSSYKVVDAYVVHNGGWIPDDPLTVWSREGEAILNPSGNYDAQYKGQGQYNLNAPGEFDESFGVDRSDIDIRFVVEFRGSVAPVSLPATGTVDKRLRLHTIAGIPNTGATAITRASSWFLNSSLQTEVAESSSSQIGENFYPGPTRQWWRLAAPATVTVSFPGPWIPLAPGVYRCVSDSVPLPDDPLLEDVALSMRLDAPGGGGTSAYNLTQVIWQFRLKSIGQFIIQSQFPERD
jgi:hypothetical protein